MAIYSRAAGDLDSLALTLREVVHDLSVHVQIIHPRSCGLSTGPTRQHELDHTDHTRSGIIGDISALNDLDFEEWELMIWI